MYYLRGYTCIPLHLIEYLLSKFESTFLATFLAMYVPKCVRVHFKGPLESYSIKP